MHRRFRKSWRRVAAFAAVWGLLLQAAVVALSIPAAFAAARPGAVPPGAMVLVICTGFGMQRIVVDAQGNRIDGQRDTAPLKDCLACHLTAPAGPTPDLAGQPLTPAMALQQRVLPVALLVADKRILSSAESRAPPVTS